MKKRVDSEAIDNAIEEIAALGPTKATEQLEQYKQLLTKAKKLAYKKGIAVINKMIATILLRLRRYNEVEVYITEGWQIAKKLKERGSLYFELLLQRSE